MPLKIETTPAPWYPVEYAGYWNIQSGSFYGDINILDADKVGYETAQANAELIAQAPDLKAQRDELVEALEAIVQACTELGDEYFKVTALTALNKVKE